ncbi:helix-turn-helix domain-containing protein [Streptomyces sp. DW26H14]|uniref:helix-turn-helix domain-containing protein n=1 Tax=Streptomyces sp. DW26H14 TaxID=3435395 RepID=UPI00403DD7AC
MPTTNRPAVPGHASRAQQFAAYIREAAKAQGFDVDTPRSGGKKALAEAMGMSPTAVGRMLSGQVVPDPENLERLARVLHLELTELLVRSGIVSDRSSLTPRHDQVTGGSVSVLTPAVAAERLGIKNPDRVLVFIAMVETLLEQERRDA